LVKSQIYPQPLSEAQQPNESNPVYSVADEQINEDLIFRCWDGVKKQVQRVIEFNNSQGITKPDMYIGHTYDGISEPMLVKQKKRWLKSTTHKKSGKWITVNSLVESGRISDMEKELFGESVYPRIELSSMKRVRTQDNSEYLVRHMRAIGLSEIGAVVSLPLNDVDFTRKVPVSASTGKLPDSTDVKILEIGSGEFTYESSPKIYITPFTKENVLATIEKYKPLEEARGKIVYMFQKEGVANEVGISSLEEFINADVDETITRLRQPAPQININSKDLASYVKLDRESKEKHAQYL
jgi:hypothetical protein